MGRAALIGLALCLAAPAYAATMKGQPSGGACAAFVKDFPAALPAYRVSFERPLTINRGFDAMLSGVDVYVLATNADLDATLKCRGEQLLRFELRMAAPPKDKALADFDAFQQAALQAALHWDGVKSGTVVKAMNSDAAEYLRASEQRGDIYLAGKVEYHQGDALDLGVIWTPTDHSFVITAQTDD